MAPSYRADAPGDTATNGRRRHAKAARALYEAVQSRRHGNERSTPSWVVVPVRADDLGTDSHWRISRALDALLDDLALAEEDTPLPVEPLTAFARIHFELADDRLPLDCDDDLAAIANFLVAHADVSLLITGHADTRGAVGYNFELSLRRAHAVAQALIDRGIEPNRLVVHAMSEAEAGPEQTSTDFGAIDRRVDLQPFRR